MGFQKQKKKAEQVNRRTPQVAFVALPCPPSTLWEWQWLLLFLPQGKYKSLQVLNLQNRDWRWNSEQKINFRRGYYSIKWTVPEKHKLIKLAVLLNIPLVYTKSRGKATYKGDWVSWFDIFKIFNLKRTQILKYLQNKGIACELKLLIRRYL